MVHDIFIKAYRQYEEAMCKAANEQNISTMEVLEADLYDKGFAREEIQDLITHQFRDITTKYHFLAYACKLFGDYDSPNDIKRLLTDEFGDCDLTDEELTKIFNIELV